VTQNSKWREFEKLITLVEHHLGPMGAVVRSPDHIADKVTGQPREVDASIRYQVGSVPILITIECRDRVSTEDVTWIEQLISKRDSIGASATVAVSATGFSGPAKEKAKAHGIETRVLKEVSDEAIRNWAEHLQLVVVRGRFNIVRTSVRLKPIGDHSEPSPEQDVLSQLAKGDVEYRFIRRTADNQLIGIGDLLRESEPEGVTVGQTLDTPLTVRVPPKSSVLIPLKTSFSRLFEDVAINAGPAEQAFKWEFAAGEASISTEHGPAEVESIEVQFSVVQQSLPLNVGRLLSYEGDDGRIAHVEERELDIGDGRVLRTMSSGRSGGDETA